MSSRAFEPAYRMPRVPLQRRLLLDLHGRIGPPLLMASVNGGVEEIVIGLGMLLMLSSTIGLLLTQVHRAVTSNGIPRFLHSPYTWASVMLLSYLYRWEEAGRSSGSASSQWDGPTIVRKGWFNLQHRPTG